MTKGFLSIAACCIRCTWVHINRATGRILLNSLFFQMWHFFQRGWAADISNSLALPDLFSSKCFAVLVVWGGEFRFAQTLLMPSSLSLHTVNWLIVGEWCFILPLLQVLWPHWVRNRFSVPADFLCVPQADPKLQGGSESKKVESGSSVSFTGDGCGAWGTGGHVILSQKPNAFHAPANGRRQERCQAICNWWKSWWYFNMWNLFLALSTDYV